jgi:hypothetical protein
MRFIALEMKMSESAFEGRNKFSKQFITTELLQVETQNFASLQDYCFKTQSLRSLNGLPLHQKNKETGYIPYKKTLYHQAIKIKRNTITIHHQSPFYLCLNLLTLFFPRSSFFS